MRIRPQGLKEAKLVIVGDCPTREEAQLGFPFLGGSGQLLMLSLAKNGFQRQNVYLTYVVKDYVEEINTLISFNKKGEPTYSDIYTKEVQSFIEEIKALQPTVILALGNVALHALTGLSSYTKYRGSILPIKEETFGYFCKVVPSVPPPICLKEYINTYILRTDVRKAVRELAYPDIRQIERNYRLRPTFEEAMAYIEDCHMQTKVGFDIETVGQFLDCFALAKNSQDVMCIPLTKGGYEYFTASQEFEIVNALAELLQNTNVTKIIQNASFDATFMFRRYGILTENIFDTMIAQGILVPQFPKGLDFLTSLYTDITYYKDDGKERIRGYYGDDDKFWLYNAKDAVALMDIEESITLELKKVNLYDTFVHQNSLIIPLLYMTERGIRMDYEGLQIKSEETRKKLDELEAEFKALVGSDINMASPKQLVDYFYGKLGLPIYSKTGKPSTDEDAMIRLSRRGVKEADVLLKHRRLAKMRSTYYEIKLDEDKRLRCSMNPVGTITGRLSSSQTIFGTGANMQNQPAEMKKYMLPDIGYVAYNIDLSQAENRIVAYLANEQAQIDAFENNKDIHSLTASYIFNKPPNLISKVDGSAKIGGGKHSERFWGKKANHGFNYGQGYKAFAYQVEIPENEGMFIYDRYHNAYPNIKRVFHHDVEEMIKSTGRVKNLFGREQMFLGRIDKTLFDQAYAFVPQSSIATIVNRYGLNFIMNNPDIFLPLEILNQVHDSLVFQIPLSVGWEEHAKMLIALVNSLEVKLHYKGRDFVIPAETTMSRNNLKDEKAVNIHGEDISSLKLQLEAIYEGENQNV